MGNVKLKVGVNIVDDLLYGCVIFVCNQQGDFFRCFEKVLLYDKVLFIGGVVEGVEIGIV